MLEQWGSKPRHFRERDSWRGICGLRVGFFRWESGLQSTGAGTGGEGFLLGQPEVGGGDGRTTDVLQDDSYSLGQPLPKELVWGSRGGEPLVTGARSELRSTDPHILF